MTNTLKKIAVLFILVCSFSLQAQDFKPYKIKSGKITYKKLKYSTHSVFKSENGVETSFSEQIPYVAEQVIYYWDEFGDIAFEKIYQVSKFGGEKLSKKVKIAERLWTGNHRYYFDFKKNKMYDDPYYLRIKCKNKFQYYQITDSWIETLYMGVEKKGTKQLLGKKATYYKIDNSQDLFTWKGLVLKDENFYTTPKGKRLEPNRTKIAVEIDTISKINNAIFNPDWLKREKLYQSLNADKIGEFIDVRPDLLTQADNKRGIKIKKNDRLLFVTTKLHLGKMEVLNLNSNGKLNIKFEWYNNDNSEGANEETFKIENASLINLDEMIIETLKSKNTDFKWEKGAIIPQNNIGIYLIKTSRTNTLKLKSYARN